MDYNQRVNLKKRIEEDLELLKEESLSNDVREDLESIIEDLQEIRLKIDKD